MSVGCWRSAIISIGLVASGCQTVPQAEEAEVQSSLVYDEVPCRDLMRQRDDLRRKYPRLPPDRGERRPLTVFAGVTPDLRSLGRTDALAAKGKINAMTHSIERRECEAGGPESRAQPSRSFRRASTSAAQ
ncbi:hypothetical protein [Aquamicrobium sp. LC103]|uniref:hypothetical protein n=1 Tax=Aquamicrobium sp. LC103 TaxID=1120658 RepID=UPI00109C7F93|nr:hypothetical protein [Aquamicrobium sp. LC103]TKT69624.1 hypothetical protein XW59_026125 [Aquamicrobium sp. LC103]